jgi:recombination protein RecA
VFYHEVEAAFDKQYAASLGMPVDRVTFVADDDAGDTVEDFFENLTELCDERIKSKAKHPVLYILDSVDALSDRAEQERRIDQGTYGTKAKQMSEVFRRLTKKLARARVTLILISQVRAKMDAVVFGKKTTRSGGKALDFYSSLIIELAEVGKDYHEVRGVKRPVAINVACQVTKNKVGPPFRNVHFPVVFNYGIDSELASFDWLRKQAKIGIDGWRMVGYDGKGTPTVRFLNANRDDAAWVRDLDKLVCSTWGEVEKEFMPPRRKYD